MKKILLSLATMFAFSVAQAQDLTSSKGEPYLPQQGDWSIGFNAGSALTYLGQAFNGSGANNGSSLFGANENIGYINGGFSFVGKKFVQDNQAVRYIANLNLNYNKVKDVDGTTSFGITGGMGKEWRKGSTRLQGFYGVDGVVGIGVPGKDLLNFMIGAQGFAGAEYFIFPKVSLGAQYAYPVVISYSSSKNPDTSVFGFNIGSKDGIGTASVLLSLYF